MSNIEPSKIEVTVPVPAVAEYVKCPACGSSWRGLEESGVCWDCNQAHEQNKAKKARRWTKLIEILGGEYPVKELTMAKFKRVIGNIEAADFAAMFKHNLFNAYFSGPAGAGKTHLAYAIAIDAFLKSENMTLEILTTEQLSRKVTGNNFDRKSETIKRLIEVDLLILDDLCRKKETENTIDAICEIMDGRKYAYRNGLIITSNYSITDLTARLDDTRLPSRIVGMVGNNGFRIEPKDAAGTSIDWRAYHTQKENRKS